MVVVAVVDEKKQDCLVVLAVAVAGIVDQVVLETRHLQHHHKETMVEEQQAPLTRVLVAAVEQAVQAVHLEQEIAMVETVETETHLLFLVFQPLTLAVEVVEVVQPLEQEEREAQVEAVMAVEGQM
jgi:hypothetical protein